MHGLCQALQKRGLCRGLLTDNVEFMTATKTVAGCRRLGMVTDNTLPYATHTASLPERQTRLGPTAERLVSLWHERERGPYRRS